MTGLWRHLVVRLKACLSDPGSAAVLIGTGLATLFVWPGLMPRGAGTPGVQDPGQATIMLLLWLSLWPVLPAAVARGRSASSGGRKTPCSAPLPVLPVRQGARLAAEALVVLGVVLAVQAPFLLAGETVRAVLGFGPSLDASSFRVVWAERALLGAAVSSPTLLLWLMPAATFEVMFLRAFAAAVALAVAARAGWLATVPSVLMVSALVGAVAVALARARWSIRLPSMARAAGAASRSRLFVTPHRQLALDFTRRVLPSLTAAAAVESVLLFLDRGGALPPMGLYWGSTVVLSATLGFVGMRPMRLKQAIAGTFGAPGFTAGEFAAAWARLPVRPGAVLRAVWVHGAVVGFALWAGVIAIAWLGGPGGGFPKGPIRDIVLPLGLLLPSVPGLLVAAAVGDRRWSWVCGLTLFLGIHVYVASLIAGVGLALRLAALGCLGIVNLAAGIYLVRRADRGD